jgi:hypothetical protein
MSDIYKHYKGGRYLLLHIATHVDTQEILIVYKSLSDNKIWCRPEKEFFEKLPDGRNRFEKE